MRLDSVWVVKPVLLGAASILYGLSASFALSVPASARPTFTWFDPPASLVTIPESISSGAITVF